MRTRHLFAPFTLGLAMAIVVLGLLRIGQPKVIAAPTTYTRYVATTGNDASNDCTLPAAPCRTVQHAVDVANSRDVIKIAAGTYSDVHVEPRNDVTTTGVVSQVAYIAKSVTLRGGYTTTNWVNCDSDANPTILDARGKGRVLYITGDISPRIENLHITGGNATGLGGHVLPGSNGGGGIYVMTATTTIRNCTIFSNTVAGDYGFGGGIYLNEISSTTLTGNTISQNTVRGQQLSRGGGVSIDRRWQSQDPFTLSDNTIAANTVSGTNAYGGGIELYEHSASLTVTTLSDNVIAGNTVDASSYGCGGGLILAYTGATVRGNVISGNSVTGTYGGGGICLSTHASAILVNNIIADNWVSDSGSGLHIKNAYPDFLHTTIARNAGGEGDGVYVTGGWGSVSLVNTVLVGHAVGVRADAGNTVNMEATLWGHGAWANSVDSMGPGTIDTGPYNYWGDPAFVGPGSDDYHIGPASAALDRGVDAGVHNDIDSEPRLGLPDLGADEYWEPGALSQIYLPLTLRVY